MTIKKSWKSIENYSTVIMFTTEDNTTTTNTIHIHKIQKQLQPDKLAVTKTHIYKYMIRLAKMVSNHTMT